MPDPRRQSASFLKADRGWPPARLPCTRGGYPIWAHVCRMELYSQIRRPISRQEWQAKAAHRAEGCVAGHWCAADDFSSADSLCARSSVMEHLNGWFNSDAMTE